MPSPGAGASSPLSHFLVNFLQPETVRRLTNPHPRTLFLSSDPKLCSAQTLQNVITALSTLNFGANLTGMPERHALGLCKLHSYPSLDLNYGGDNRAVQNCCDVFKKGGVNSRSLRHLGLSLSANVFDIL